LGEPGDYRREIIGSSRGELHAQFQDVPAAGEHLGCGVFFDHLKARQGDDEVNVYLFQAAAGDTNGDAQIDNADLQRILGANSFNQPGDWGWSEGDFTGDGVVNNNDLQAILATNLFNTGPYAATTSTVPEPGTAAMLLGGVVALLIAARRRAGDCPNFCGRTPQKWDCPLPP